MLAVLLQHPLLAMGFPKPYIQNTISDEASQPATYKKKKNYCKFKFHVQIWVLILYYVFNVKKKKRTAHIVP